MRLSCLYDFEKSLFTGEMDNVQRRVAGHGGEMDHPVDGFGFASCRPAQRMIFRFCTAVFDVFMTQVIDHAVVFTVTAITIPSSLACFQDLIETVVFDHEIIGRINFETGETFLCGNLAHFFQDGVIDMLDHAVEAVIDHGFASAIR